MYEWDDASAQATYMLDGFEKERVENLAAIPGMA